MAKNPPDIPALFARLEKSLRRAETILRELTAVYPLYSCELPRLYARQKILREQLSEIKKEFGKIRKT